MIIEKLLNSKKIFVRQKQESIEKIINIILYDYENVNNLYGIETLDRSSTVYIFFTNACSKISFEDHDRINKSKAIIIRENVINGSPNALDFQLSSFLGYLISKNQKLNHKIYYYIVSKDKGYRPLINYWGKRKINLYLIDKLEDIG